MPDRSATPADRQQAAIAEFCSLAFRLDDEQAILAAAASICANALDAHFGQVCRYRPKEDDLLIVAGSGWGEKVIGHRIFPIDETSPQGRSFITGHPAICHEMRRQADFKLLPLYIGCKIASTLDVTIQAEGEAYGELQIAHDQPMDYTRRDVEFLSAFAGVCGAAIAACQRATARRRIMEEKDRKLEQGRILAEELQHRVRNNMQLIYGMLNKQLSDTQDAAGRRGIRSIARRVSTLAQLYDNLLGAEMARTTDFGSFANALCHGIAEVQAARINLACDFEPLLLDLDTVTALGIVIAELVTNSYDHAFPCGEGSITVSVHAPPAGDDLATLTIRDTGTGFVPQYNSKRHGLGLVRRLIEQVRGTVDLISSHGATWRIRFPVRDGAGLAI